MLSPGSTQALPASLAIPRAVTPSTAIPKQQKRYHRLHPLYQPPARVTMKKPQLPAIVERAGVSTLGYVKRAREDAVRLDVDLALPRGSLADVEHDSLLKLEQAPSSEIQIVKRDNTKISSHGLLENVSDTVSQSSASSSSSAAASSARSPLSRSRRSSLEEEKSATGEGQKRILIERRAPQKQMHIEPKPETFTLPGPGTPGFLIEQILNETYEKWASTDPFRASLKE